MYSGFYNHYITRVDAMQKDTDNNEELNNQDDGATRKIEKKVGRERVGAAKKHNGESDGKGKSDDLKDVKVSKSFFVYLIIGLIIVTFVLTSGVVPGFMQFLNELNKRVENNPDGTISIQQHAPVGENSRNPDAYIGKVINKKIQFGRQDEFNINLESIEKSPSINGYQKYMYIRQLFYSTVDKIIGTYNAERMGITISNEQVFDVVSKRYYTKQDGSVDYDRMASDRTMINSKYTEPVRSELLYENYEFDYFDNLPVDKEEVSSVFKLENTKVKIKYFDFKFDNIDMLKLDSYLKINDEKFKLYRVTKMIFAESDKKGAESALIEILKDKSKFTEIGNKLKLENKVINVIADTEYRFLDDFYNEEMSKGLKATKIGDVCSTIIKDDNIGYIVVRLDDARSADISSDYVIDKVKKQYVIDNKDIIVADNEKKARELYAAAQKTADYDKLSLVYQAKLESPASDYNLAANNFPNVSTDRTDDAVFIGTVFNSAAGTVLPPKKYDDGVMVVVIDSKIAADPAQVEAQFDTLYKSTASKKTENIKSDFYSSEKKKHKVVDNFNYVFKIQDFLNMQQGDQGQ